MSIYSMAIIGTGPAGISTAVEAVQNGIDPSEILFIEKFGEPCHSIKVKYPNAKPVVANYKGMAAQCFGQMCIGDMEKDELIDYLESQLASTNVKVHYNQEVNKIIKTTNGYFTICTQNDCFFADTVFVAIGNMSSPRALGVPVDDEIADKLVYDLNNIPLEPHKVLVIGGGDSASEYVQSLKKYSHDVSLSYRKPEFSRMLESNKQALLDLESNSNVKLLMPTQILKIINNNNRCQVYFDNGQSEEFDFVVAAIGGERPKNYLEKIGISLEGESGEEFVESEMQGLFILGDLAAGPKGGSIIKAFNSAHRAMKTACTFYLDCQ